MSDETAISWTEHTFSPWWGCSRVSAACQSCYADTLASRWGHHLWGVNADRKVVADATWRKPLTWDRAAAKEGRPALVFCASMADVFEARTELDKPRERLWGLIEATPHLRWQLLTKRPENVAGMVPWAPGAWPSHVWLGATVEQQRFAEDRIGHLFAAGPRLVFISAEPLLGRLDLTGILGNSLDPSVGQAIGWVIAGGETGRKARPTHPEWLRSLHDECADWGVPFHLKQLGEWTAATHPSYSWYGKEPDAWVNEVTGKTATEDEARAAGGSWCAMYRVGKRAAGRRFAGVTHDGFPAVTS